MSIDGSTNNVAGFETDLRDALRARNAGSPNVSRDAGNDYSGLVTGISVRSVQEIDHLIAGLQGLREKLNSDADRLHRAITQHAAFSQAIVDLTKNRLGRNGIRGQIKRGLKAFQFPQEKSPDHCRDFEVALSRKE